jgi:hypothetical protein
VNVSACPQKVFVGKKLMRTATNQDVVVAHVKACLKGDKFFFSVLAQLASK